VDKAGCNENIHPEPIMKLLQNFAATTAITTATILISSSSNVLAASSLTIIQNFQGSTFDQSRFLPPDTMGAVGTNHYVELINGRYAVYNKTGNGIGTVGTTLFASNLDAFWTNAGVTGFTSTTFDPRVVFDSHSKRWFAASVDRPTNVSPTGDRTIANNFLLAVSKTDNPLDGWTGFKFAGDPTRFTDFPTLGLNRDGVFLGSNNFGRASAFDTSIVSIPKADLLLATPTIANRQQFNNLPFATYAATPQPVIDFGSGGKGIVISNFTGSLASPQNSIRRTDINNPASGPSATLSGPAVIPVQAYSIPPDSFQPNGTRTLDTGDNRFGSPLYKVGNSIWLAHAVESGGRSAVRWYELDATTNAIKQTGTIGDANHDYFYPSIAANEFGNVVIGFSRAGQTEFASSYAIAGITVNGVTTFDTTPTLLKAGLDNYSRLDGIGRNRWGDYSATMVDPNDPFSFWTIQEFALTSASSGAGRWATNISQLQVTPIPTPALLPGLLGLGVSTWRKRRKSAKVAA
jgi:hypothetical protein